MLRIHYIAPPLRIWLINMHLELLGRMAFLTTLVCKAFPTLWGAWHKSDSHSNRTCIYESAIDLFLTTTILRQRTMAESLYTTGPRLNIPSKSISPPIHN